jgi:hypothetical protein
VVIRSEKGLLLAATEMKLAPAENSCHAEAKACLEQSAVVVAIEQSAERDRQLFPDVGSTTNASLMNHSQPSSLSGSPAKRQKTDNNYVSNLFICCFHNCSARLERLCMLLRNSCELTENG